MTNIRTYVIIEDLEKEKILHSTEKDLNVVLCAAYDINSIESVTMLGIVLKTKPLTLFIDSCVVEMSYHKKTASLYKREFKGNGFYYGSVQK